MSAHFSIAVTGDSIINRRLSVYTDKRFLAMIEIIRNADVAFTHLETLIHDYDGAEVYPAAEAGWTWMRSPRFIADELKWAGFNIVSHASNHALDYSYGGLYSTWKALTDSGISFAGTGQNLGEARDAAYIETGKGRAALISMTSSFTGWARAGEARRDLKGRPGINPLRFYYEVDGDTIEMIKRLAIRLGWWVTKVGKTYLLNPAGIHNTIFKFVEGEKAGIVPVAYEDDVAANIRSIKNARRQADYVLVHLHSHEWDPESGLHVPAMFVPPFAKSCIDAGADVFIGEGSHAPLRGVEIYKKKPIFYDPGDFILMSNTVTKQPADFYWREGYSAEARQWEATPADGFDARLPLIHGESQINPPGGYFSEPIKGAIIGVCSFNNEKQLIDLKLYPLDVSMTREPRSQSGIPMLSEPKEGKRLIEYMEELSAPFGTRIEYKEGVGIVKV
jgi:poly-gamma-glutamate capsule biosynthesis protein CapA/YwtB (metallophosphatase superfamily)